MKKYIYILSILLVGFTSCETDYDAEDQGIELQELPNYVAFSVDGAGKTLAAIDINENTNTGDDVNVEIPGGTLSDVTINYSLSGTAVFGVDYAIPEATASGGSITIDYNNTPNVDGLPFNEDIIVIALPDGVADGDKTVIITLTSASNAEGEIVVGRGGQQELSSATINIIDVD